LKNFANFLVFNACWLVAVEGAKRGALWLGPAAFGAMVLHHLVFLTPARERSREVLYLLAVGLVGTVLDSTLEATGLIAYPTSDAAWDFAVVPPWITALWIGFATMPRLSLAWLGRRPWWFAFCLGAIGGPMSFYGGTKFGAIAASGTVPWATYLALSLEYALLTPLMLRLAPARAAAESAGPSAEPVPHH
jgi:hypothetical protein